MIQQDVGKNAMQAYTKYKSYYDKKTIASKLKEADYVNVLQPKADHQGNKIPFTEFRWIGPYVIEKVIEKETTSFWYAKLAPTRRKCFIVCKYASSHPAKPQLTYISRHQDIKPIRIWASNTMICMPERGSETMNSHFLTPIIVMKRQPTQPNFQYSLVYALRKWGTHQEVHMSVPEKIFSSNGKFMWRNGYVSRHGTRCGDKLRTTEK